MFWKFDLHTSSHLDTLLEREDLSLPELLDEEDVLQECKVVNRKLLDFLLQPPHLQAMVAWVTQEPPASGEERLRYKYPSVACEILTSDVPQINDALGADESLLNRLYGFLQSSGCLNPLLASFFSKVMGILINRKTDQLVSFLRKKDDFVDLLLQHIGTSAIMDLLLRLLTCVERPQLRQEVVNWLNEEKIVQRLIEQIHPSKDDNQHSNASQSLCDIIRLSREQVIQVQDSSEPDQLLATLEKQETIEQLLSNMLEGQLNPSVLVSGVQVLLTLLEPRRPRSESVIVNNFFSSVDGQLELLGQATLDSSVSSMGALHALRPRLTHFHQLLFEPLELEPLHTTWGILAPPLGNTRLHVVKLLASALSANDAALTQELLALDVPNTMLDLFFHYVFNNFLHTQVEGCVSTMLSAGPPADSSLETPAPNLGVKHLLQQCRLVERILTSWEENERVQSAGGPRKGYMGHLTRMANALVQNTEKGPNAEQLGQLLKEMSAEQQEQWEAFVSGPLAETNKKNMVDLVNTHHLHSSSDDEDDRLKEFNFPEEAVLQQAFMDFQMQRMTSAFIDHFGFNDEEFGEQEESVNAPFDKTANITFSLNTDDENPNTNLLEICYKDRIQQFDDEEEEEEEEGQGSGESDGEDGAWQGSQLARGPRLGQPPGVRHWCPGCGHSAWGSQAVMDVRRERPPRSPRSSAQLHLGSLSPFLLTCTAYFLLWIPEDPPSRVGALVKCLPVLCLVGLLRANPGSGSGGGYSLRLQVALLFSALGDVFLIWPENFLYGVLAFGMAQLLYSWAFGFSPLRSGLLVPIVLYSLPFSGLLLLHLPPDLVLPVSAYGLALSTMLWRGLARGGSARWGALLFATSDSLLSWHTFIQPLAHGRLLIMTTYYAAQLLITLSAFQSPKLKTH